MATSSQFATSIPTTSVWDPAQIMQTNLQPDLKEILIRMYQNLNLMANVLNTKDTGVYNNSFQIVNSQQWFPNPLLSSATQTNPTLRPVNRLVINFGALPNAGAKAVNHNIPINGSYTFTRIYGTASDTTGLNYIPIPYASPVLINNIQLDVNATQVIITTGSNRTNFNVCYIVLEWITS